MGIHESLNQVVLKHVVSYQKLDAMFSSLLNVPFWVERVKEESSGYILQECSFSLVIDNLN